MSISLFSFHFSGIQTCFSPFLLVYSNILTRQPGWGLVGGVVFGLLASPTSMTPGPMPSTPSLAAHEHSGTPLTNPGQLSDCFPGARHCASIPLGSITKPNHWHCLPALKPEPGESTDIARPLMGNTPNFRS